MIKPIAIYLPQFHPFAENNKWWGEGFTEWRNVVKAKSLFPGHYQPHLPANLGFYDLRLQETMIAQAAMAKKFGIYGFCYYHYWFNGKLLMEQPLHQMLDNKEMDMPFMLCWANENWTRRWDGLDNEVLIKQEYGDQDDEDHIRYLLKFLTDPRYIRVDNKPVVIIYKAFLLPDSAKTASTWRRIAAEHHLELYLCHMEFGYNEVNALAPGFDAVIDFEPFGIRRPSNVFTEVIKRRQELYTTGLISRLFRKFKIELVKNPLLRYNILDYEYAYQNLKPLNSYDFKIFPSLVPGWDNTARRKESPTLIYHNSDPGKFALWLKSILADFKPYSEDENFVFINAWNEWAEGNHLEPCERFGLDYLKALAEALAQNNNN